MESIERFVEGLEPESFKHDDKTSSAAIRKFEIIGEAAKNAGHIVEDDSAECNVRNNGSGPGYSAEIRFVDSRFPDSIFQHRGGFHDAH